MKKTFPASRIPRILFAAALLAGALVLIVTLSGAPSGDSVSEVSDNPDVSLSPYFQVNGAEAGVDALPLKSTQVDAVIAGGIAGVRVVQTYQNEGATPLEARYIFPASTRAAVNGMTMTVGERRIRRKSRKRRRRAKSTRPRRARAKPPRSSNRTAPTSSK